MTTIGLLHPGAMGASIGAALVAAGHRVVWASQGRSDATRERARTARLEDAGGLEGLVRESDWVVSVCPPAAARELAESVLSTGFRGLYLDANAIAPETSRAIARRLEAAGAEFVDGGIVGPPAWHPGSTHLHLSGGRADVVAQAFAGTNVEAKLVPGGPGAASALKMAFASWTKGSAALLANVWALAREAGVDAELRAEWETFAPDAAAQLAGVARGTAPKAWRFVAEMLEIAATYEDAGLPGGFHRAAAEVYARLADFKDSQEAPSSDEVADRLRRRD